MILGQLEFCPLEIYFIITQQRMPALLLESHGDISLETVMLPVVGCRQP